MSHRVSLLLLLAACTVGDDTTDPKDSDDSNDTEVTDTDPTANVWQLHADNVPGGYYLSTWSNGPDEALIVGGDQGTNSGVLAHYTNDTLCVEDMGTPVLWWIHGATPGDWYAVGAEGTIIHSVDGVRTDESVPSDATLFGVFDNGTDVYAVGSDVDTLPVVGEVWHRREGNWELLADDLPGLAFKVWEDWVIGDSFAYRITGTTLSGTPVTEVPLPDGTPRLLTVRGRTTDEVWAVGGRATPVMLHYANDSWSDVTMDPLCTPGALNGVWTAPNDVIAVAGNGGIATILDGDEWTCADFPLTFRDFHAAWRHGDEMLYVGGNLLNSSDNIGTIASYGPAKTIEVLDTCE